MLSVGRYRGFSIGNTDGNCAQNTGVVAEIETLSDQEAQITNILSVFPQNSEFSYFTGANFSKNRLFCKI